MTTPIINVSLAYARYRDPALIEFTESIETNLFPQESFSSPPFTLAELKAMKDSFSAALAATAQGGTSATAEKNIRRSDLLAMLKQLALYVETASNNNLAKLLSSGFFAVSRNRARVELPAPVNLNATFGTTGSVMLKVKAVKNAKSYETGYAMIGADNMIGEWQVGPPATSSQKIRVGGLTSGQLYVFRVRAVGGSTGTSDWSDVTNHRAY